MREKIFYVYIMASRSLTLYIGSTSNLHKRVWQHKNKLFDGFTAKYKIDRLVYWESFDDPRNMVNRERQLKRWSRVKKLALIQKVNPTWLDLSEGWYHNAGPSTRAARATSTRPKPGAWK